jgi:hypothetical protein
MSTSTRTKSTKKSVAQAAAPVVEETVAPVVEVVAPVAAQETVQETTQETAQETTQEVSFRSRLEALVHSRLSQIDLLKREVQELKKLQREHDLLLKEATRKQKKTKLPRDFSKPKKATGFAEPVVVSDDMYDFLVKTKAVMKDPNFVPKCQEDLDNWPRLSVKRGVPVARTDVTSHISKYIKDHNLQNPESKREIVPDAALKKLFSEPTELSDKNDPNSRKIHTYLQLQRYLNAHFQKKTA